ncbi:UDP-glycosyltransferase 88B1 [Zea mays]|uniref:Glycosyltransferase n=1 Tax=Zea mays TaxID=4577 RepID=A0A3L6DQF7_MAIZE|nr:UDP-glycosyltransferase 88B1 [Zea mays]
MKKTVVLYPGLVVSHFMPMMQLADVLLEEGYAVVVALIDVTNERNTTFAAAIDRAMASSSKLAATFHTLPRIRDPPTVTNDVNLLLGYFEIIRRYNEHLRELLRSIPRQSVHAVVVDSLSNAALDVAAELGVPAYSFFASNASALAVCLQLPWARAEGQPPSFKELGDATVNFHGVPPMPASHLIPEVLEDPGTEIYKAMMNSLSKNLEAGGILVNTFASLEARAVAALKDPHFLAESRLRMPPVYCVGPLVEKAAETKEEHACDACLAWLDEQPELSVVFLCFGSVGSSNHSETQLKEIAVGLERSGQRFLWVVRAPLGDNPEREFGDKADPDLQALLPEGFLERTRGRGLVVKLWAPQVAVLQHKATGAFVTHCGWNSVLEGVMAGVPMLCWPLYAEQKMNKVLMVEELRIGVELAGWHQHGLVKAEELEAKVRLVMEAEEGEQLRARVRAHKEAADMVWKDGGSSRVSFRQFLSDVVNVSPDRTLG